MPGAGRRARVDLQVGVRERAAGGGEAEQAASCLSGRMAIRLPPALTQSENIVTCAAVSGMLAEDHDVVAAEHGGVTAPMSCTSNAFSPSARRISA